MTEESGKGAGNQPAPLSDAPRKEHTPFTPDYIFTLPSEHSPERPFPLHDYAKGYFCPITSVLKAYLRYDGHRMGITTETARYRKRLTRRLTELADGGLIDLAKPDKDLVMWRLTSNGLNLIRRSQNSNQKKKPKKGLFDLPSNAGPGRMESLRLTMKERMLPPRSRERIQDLFTDWMDDVRDKSVILTYKSEAQNPDAPLMFLPYRTRFTSMERKQANLKTYEAIWTNSHFNYRTAVFVTLTTDPKMHQSVYHANRHYQKALNRFLSVLTKRLGHRPRYLNVHEFQKNGLLHSHIVIFGLNYLMDHKRLSKTWVKCGQGLICYIYGLQSNGLDWHWIHARPSDAKKGGGVANYLKKYLKKALFDEKELELYWTFNKRFFSYSRKLKPADPKRPYNGPALTFIGACNSDMISTVIRRRSTVLWRRAAAAACLNGPGPPAI